MALKPSATCEAPYMIRGRFVCKAPVISVAMTADAKTIVAAACDRRLYVLNDSGVLLWEPKVLDFEGWSAAISADGSRIVVGTAQKNPSDGSVYVFDRYGVEVFQRRIKSPVWGVSISATGSRVVAAAWDNTVYCFDQTAVGYSGHNHTFRADTKGFYGIRLTQDGSLCYVASYEVGIYVLNFSLTQLLDYASAIGLYNLALTADGATAVVGRVDGRVQIFTSHAHTGAQTIEVCRRPVCGVAVTSDGFGILAGSFDGRAYFCALNGRTYWTYQTRGEVWSTALSSDGATAVVGSGDNTVTILTNNCTSRVLRKVAQLETSISQTEVSEQHFQNLFDSYEEAGLIEYGSDFLEAIIPSRPKEFGPCLDQIIVRRLERYVSEHPSRPRAWFLLGTRHFRNQQYFDAIRCLQSAASDPALRHSALTLASTCFAALGLRAASAACQVQARSIHLDDTSRMVLYNLARSHEDQQETAAATAIYEALLAWDITYRNALERLYRIKRQTTQRISETDRRDFTGSTVSLLGPEIPRRDEVDERLLPVIEARAKELQVIRGRRGALQRAWQALWRDDLLVSNMPVGKLSHNIAAYIKYDFSPPEDEIKKHLELVHTISVIQRFDIRGRSLDIGTATGRYPGVLSQLGFCAFGIDRESEAISFARTKLVADDPSMPQLMLADGQNLPFKGETFNLMTCMMGTLNYCAFEDAKALLRDVYRCGTKGSVCIVSTWDPECPFLSFLAMYDTRQKERLAANLLSQMQMKDLMRSAGFSEVWIEPVGLLPDIFHYELGLEQVKPEDVRRVIEIELAAEAVASRTHGQLFLTIGLKTGN